MKGIHAVTSTSGKKIRRLLAVTAALMLLTAAFPLLVLAESVTSISAPASIWIFNTPDTVSDISISDGGAATVSLDFTVDSGTLQSVPSKSVDFSSSGSNNLKITGTVSDVNAYMITGFWYTRTDTTIDYATLTVVATGTGSDTTTVRLQFLAVNDPPVITAPAAQNAKTGNTLTFSSGSNALSFSDSDLGSDSAQCTLSVSAGTLTLASLTGLTFSTGDGTGDASMTFDGTAANINAALDGLAFTPDGIGDCALSITVNDLGHTGMGGAQSDFKNVVIHVADGTPPVPSGARQTDGGIVLSFPEAVTAGAGSVTLSGGGQSSTVSASVGTISSDGKTITFRLDDFSGLTLQSGTYTLTLGADAFENAKGNGNAAGDAVTFTAEAVPAASLPDTGAGGGAVLPPLLAALCLGGAAVLNKRTKK